MLYVTPLITIYLVILTVIVGLCMGSFINCWSLRIANGESVWHGRSHCATCGHQLGFHDLVPVFSWLASKGRCRYCGERISVRYPLVELLCAILYVTILLRYDVSIEALELICFSSILLLIALTDLDSYLIPNGCIIAAIVVRLVYILVVAFLDGADIAAMLIDSLIGGVAVFVPLLIIVLIADKVLGKESMGGGDLKLFFVAGLYFGWMQCLLLVVVACLIGIVLALVLPPRKEPVPAVAGGPSAGDDGIDEIKRADDERKDEVDEKSAEPFASRPIPFGPAIALACWFVMLYGLSIVTWYFGLF